MYMALNTVKFKVRESHPTVLVYFEELVLQRLEIS